MKLLFDQNLSPELANLLADLFPESQHVNEIGMGCESDADIAAHAKQRGFIVVTKDSDFLIHAAAPLQCIGGVGSPAKLQYGKGARYVAALRHSDPLLRGR